VHVSCLFENRRELNIARRAEGRVKDARGNAEHERHEEEENSILPVENLRRKLCAE